MTEDIRAEGETRLTPYNFALVAAAKAAADIRSGQLSPEQAPEAAIKSFLETLGEQGYSIIDRNLYDNTGGDTTDPRLTDMNPYKAHPGGQ